MNSKTITLVENLCRTCMNSDEEDYGEAKKRKALSIFNEPEIIECKNITIMELLMITIPQLNIECEDMLPKRVCESCFESLINAYKFQKMCITVDQKLRQMIEDESSVEVQVNKDPLKDGLMDISIDNVAVSQAIDDLTNILKVEMDEPLIEQNEMNLSNQSAAENEDLKFETEDERWEDKSNDNESSNFDSDSKSETPPNNKKRKYSKLEVKQMKETIDASFKKYKNSKGNAFKKDENTLGTTKKLGNNEKLTACTEDEKKNFICDECGSRLSTRKSLKRHKRIHQRPVGQKNTHVKTKNECEICKKIFQQSSSLKDHLRTHTGEQPYLCSECGKAFKSLSNMKQHFLRHGTDRPYVCPVCPKRFPCLSDLASHKAVHNKTKSHVCDICGAAFVKPYLLKKHKMYHTGEKNHKCDYCNMRFVLADQCRRHMRTHTGEKPYKCKYCERAFAQSNDLIKHLRGHLGDNVYKCDLCPQGFRLQGDLRVHFNTHKNDDDETKAKNLQALRDEEQRIQMKFGLVKDT